RGKVPKAEGGRLLTLLLMLQARSRAPPSAPFGAASPAAQGKRQHEFQAPARMAFPSPAKRGKVPKGGRGRAFDFALDASSKIKSAPFSPIRGSFPRCAGEATARVPSSRANGFPFPCEAGEGAERRKGAGF